MTSKVLGRGLAELGLDAILNEVDTQQSLGQLPIDSIDVDPNQPRQTFDDASLHELAESIRAHGVLQPVLVIQQGSRYQLVAGERRWRASQMAGLRQIPAIVGQFTQQQRQAVAIVENIQREDLTAIEQARAINTLINEHQLTHQSLGELLGYSRSQVSNLLRLLQLDETVQQALLEKRVQMGHARALLTLNGSQQQELLQHIIVQDWSVRQTEQATQRVLKPTVPRTKPMVSQASFKKSHCRFKLKQDDKARTLTVRVADEATWQDLLSQMESWCEK